MTWFESNASAKLLVWHRWRRFLPCCLTPDRQASEPCLLKTNPHQCLHKNIHIGLQFSKLFWKNFSKTETGAHVNDAFDIIGLWALSGLFLSPPRTMLCCLSTNHRTRTRTERQVLDRVLRCNYDSASRMHYKVVTSAVSSQRTNSTLCPFRAYLLQTGRTRGGFHAKKQQHLYSARGCSKGGLFLPWSHTKKRIMHPSLQESGFWLFQVYTPLTKTLVPRQTAMWDWIPPDGKFTKGILQCR